MKYRLFSSYQLPASEMERQLNEFASQGYVPIMLSSANFPGQGIVVSILLELKGSKSRALKVPRAA